MRKCIFLSVALQIRHLSLKLLSGFECSKTCLFICAGQQSNVKSFFMDAHFLHKVVNNSHINQSSLQQSKHLAFIISCVAASPQRTASVLFTLPPRTVLTHCSASPFIGPKFGWHHGNQGSHGTLPGTSPRSLQGGTSSALVSTSVCVATAGRYDAVFGRNSGPRGGMLAR